MLMGGKALPPVPVQDSPNAKFHVKSEGGGDECNRSYGCGAKIDPTIRVNGHPRNQHGSAQSSSSRKVVFLQRSMHFRVSWWEGSYVTVNLGVGQTSAQNGLPW